jgi:hypothetical protein
MTTKKQLSARKAFKNLIAKAQDIRFKNEAWKKAIKRASKK